MVNSRSRFARNISLTENNQFRSSQLTPSVGTLAIILAPKDEFNNLMQQMINSNKIKLKKIIILFFLLSSFQSVFCQIIVKEGKGIDSLTLGIKQSKIIKFLGNKFSRQNLEDNEFILRYREKKISFVFDKDSIVYEIIIEPSINIKTSKGLELKKDFNVSYVEKIYGKDWWTAKDSNEIGYDLGIRFEFEKNKTIKKIIIEESHLEGQNDFTFYEYIEGYYIPKNLNECYLEFDKILDKKRIEEIKKISEEEFTANSHFGLGLFVRNNWALWKGSRLYVFFKEKGITHPDDMSGIVLKSYHRNLNGIDVKLDEQIKYYQEYWNKQK